MGKDYKHSTLRSRKRESAFISLIQHSTGSPSHNNLKKRRSIRHSNWKGRGKLSLFIVDMILYIENPNDMYITRLLYSKQSGIKKMI